MNDAVHIGIRGASMTSLLEQVPAPLSESTPSMFLSPIDLAYIAGLFDGEGTIVINLRRHRTLHDPRRKKTYHSSPQHTLIVSMSMTDRTVMTWMHSLLGGSLKPYSGTNLPVWKWSVCSASAVPVLEALLPYLRVKRQQAELGISFQCTRTNQSGTTKRKTNGTFGAFRIADEELARREAARVSISNLNHQGAPFKCLL